MRLDLAIRTSQRKRDARSPQQQHDMAQACAQAYGYDIVRVHDSGRDESGKTMNRATLNAVMERVQRGETDGLIVALADRLGRAPIEEAMAYVRALTGIGHLVLADMGGVPINLHDATTETNVVLQLQMARQFWLTKANGFKRSQADAVKAGKHVGPTPLGYRREKGRLYEDPEQGPIVRRAFEIAAQVGLHDAVSYLQREVPGRRWNTDHVRRLLASRTYLGESRSGDLLNERAHDPLATLPVWTAAQSDPRMRRSNGDYPLSHAVRCGRCGEGLTGQLQTVRERQYRRMRCANRACEGGVSIGADALEAYIREVMEKALDDEAFRDQFSPAGLAHAKRAFDAAEAETQRYLNDLQVRALVGDAKWRKGLHERTEAEREARDAFVEIANQAEQFERLPLAGELGDPAKFAQGLRAITSVGDLIVAPGRGRTVVERTRFAPFQGDVMPGALAA